MARLTNELEFKMLNKEQLIDTYRSEHERMQTESTDRKESTPVAANRSMTPLRRKINGKITVSSKKEFTELEYIMSTHRFPEAYFDKDYLDICRVQNFDSVKNRIMERIKEDNSKLSLNLTSSFIEKPAEVIAAGEVMFIETRSSKLLTQSFMQGV